MRRLLFIAGALVMLFLTLALLGFQALKSGAGKDKLASAIESALGQPVVIVGMSVALLPSPALEATQVRIGSADRAAASGITLAGLHAAPSLLSFLPGWTRSLGRVHLVGLVVAARRDTAGAMSDTRFQSLTATAVSDGGKARTDDLALRAGELSLLGQGTLGFDRLIDLHTTAHLSAAKTGQLAQHVAASKQLQDRRGEIAVPVTITGTATAPKITVDVQPIVKTQVQGELQRELKKLLPKP